MANPLRHLYPRPADVSPRQPPVVPRNALVLALAAVTATYLFLDRPAATAGPGLAVTRQLASESSNPVPVLAATRAALPVSAVAASTSKNAPPGYYMFINPIELVYEE